jgi:hypothetical protein
VLDVHMTWRRVNRSYTWWYWCAQESPSGLSFVASIFFLYSSCAAVFSLHVFANLATRLRRWCCRWTSNMLLLVATRALLGLRSPLDSCPGTGRSSRAGGAASFLRPARGGATGGSGGGGSGDSATESSSDAAGSICSAVAACVSESRSSCSIAPGSSMLGGAALRCVGTKADRLRRGQAAAAQAAAAASGQS